MIVFEDVTFTYPGAGVFALSHLAFDLEPGVMLAVVGANGSGKSTLARLSDGLLVPDAGRVFVDGIDTAEEASAWDVRSRVGLVLQNPDNQIVGTVVEEDVAFGPENLGIPQAEIRIRVDEALAAVGLSGLERREPHLLSEGQKQRLAIAGALAMRPGYLVLDEPSAMLDPAGRDGVFEVLEALKSDGCGILLITQNLAEIVRADRVLALDGGALAYSGPPSTFLEDDGLLSRLGLEAPSTWRLSAALCKLGLSVPRAGSAQEIVDALWPS